MTKPSSEKRKNAMPKRQENPRPRSWRDLLRDRPIAAWALYDWANSAFSTTVMAGFFPIFFKSYWSAGSNVNVSTFQLGLASSLSSGALAVLSPVLGAIADRGSQKRRFLIAFSFLGILMTALLPLVARGNWLMAALLYLFASIGFAGGNTFYDALLMSVSPRHEMDRVSSLGFALGYLGGGILFAVNVAMTLKPALFGLSSVAEAVRLSFFTVALWWAMFSIPLLIFVREEKASAPRPSVFRLAREGIGQVFRTGREVARLREVVLFLSAYFFYIDGVNTIMRMAVDYGLSRGFASESLIVALLLTQFVGFPAAIAFGHLATMWGARMSILIAIAVYAGVTTFAYFMQATWQFYVLAAVIGLVQGGIQALSRSTFARLIPEDRSGEFFGFFNMLGKFSSMMGPFLVGWVSLATGDSRLSILSVLVLFAVGAALLICCPPFSSPRSERLRSDL